MRERNSHKRASFLFICLIGLSLPGFLYAQIVISEVMYDVEGPIRDGNGSRSTMKGQRRLIFPFGNYSRPIRPTKSQPSGHHYCHPGGFAILADVPDKFLADHSGFKD